MARTIKIRKYLIRNLLLSFIIGGSLLYCLEHFGHFKYFAHSDTPLKDQQGNYNLTVYHKSSDMVYRIIYISFYDSEIETAGNGYNVGDFAYSSSDFNKYSVKSYYYTQATFKDFKYAICFSISIFALTLFFTEIKIKLT